MRYLQKERISRHLLLCLVIFVLQGCASRSPNHDEAENDINKFINNYEKFLLTFHVFQRLIHHFPQNTHHYIFHIFKPQF